MNPFEMLGEMALVVEAYVNRDVGDGRFAHNEEATGALHASLKNKLVWGKADGFFEAPSEMERA